ncbi:MAG: TRAP transporter large permease [Silicimonas sp.]
MSLLFLVLAILILGGLPIAFAFGLAALAGLWMEDLAFLTVASRMFAGLDTFVLLAAPFYIVVGELMVRARLSDRLISLSALIVGRIRGGTAYANIVASILFAGISGTAIADIASLGRVFINAMPKEGYSKAFAASLTVASSIIGPIIPPSVIMVIYAALADLSVLTLFAAGIVPGLLLGGSCALVVFIKSLRGDLPLSAMMVPRPERPKALRDGLIVLSLPMFILFGTISGVFTPTEAGGIAVLLAILLGGIVFRELTLRSTLESFRVAARLTAALFLIFATVQIINYVLILAGVQGHARALLGVFSDYPFLFLVVCATFFILVGLVLDAGPALFLMAPILLPLTRQMGIDDSQFSMVMLIAVTIGLITPPVGVCLFVTCRIGEISMGALWKELRWFFLAEIGVLLLLCYFPVLSNGIPTLIGR